jgi:hypothetical protein
MQEVLKRLIDADLIQESPGVRRRRTTTRAGVMIA